MNLSKNPTPQTNKLPNFVSFSFDLFVFALFLFSIPLHVRSPFVLHVILFLQKQKLTESSLRFLLDGERIGADETPKSLELEDQDQIDCVLQQTGGFN